MRVIGRETELAAGLERHGEVAHEFGLDETARPVAALRPRIREKNMRDGNALRRQEILHGIAEFEAEDADVIEPGAD